MAKTTKRQKQLQEKGIDLKKAYPLKEGIELVKKTSITKFDNSIDIAINLGIDIKNPLQVIRTSAVLPHSTGKTPRVLVICTSEKEAEAKAAQADHVGYQDYIQKIAGGWRDVDVIVAMPSLMPEIGKLGRVLGPAHLMPSPKEGTVTNDIGQTVKAIKSGKISLKTDKQGIVHKNVGRVSSPTDHIAENLQEIVSTIIRARHSSVKGNYLRKITLSSSMGLGIQININSIKS